MASIVCLKDPSALTSSWKRRAGEAASAGRVGVVPLVADVPSASLMAMALQPAMLGLGSAGDAGCEERWNGEETE
jgi:hypothetical protein